MIAQNHKQDSSRDDDHVKGMGAQWKSGEDLFASMKGINKEDGIGKTGEKSRDKNEQDEENSSQKIPYPTPSSITKVHQESVHTTKK